MLYGLVLIVHLFVCMILVLVILLQAGRGGGLADTFGGTAQSLFGTRGTVYLTRATTVCAALFMLTSLTLTGLSARRGRSLMERSRPAPETSAPEPGSETKETPPAAEKPASPPQS